MSTVLEPDHWMKFKYELDLYIPIDSFSKYIIIGMTQFYVCTGGCFPHSRRGCTGWTPLLSTCSWWTLCPSMTSATDTLFTGIYIVTIITGFKLVSISLFHYHIFRISNLEDEVYFWKLSYYFTLTRFLLNIWSISEKRLWILRVIEE